MFQWIVVGHCSHCRGKAEVDRSLGLPERGIRVKTAKRFSRLAFACLAGDQPMRHPCFRQPNSILPGYAALFYHPLIHQAGLAIARRCKSPASMLELGHEGLVRHLRDVKVRVQQRTIEKVLAWASQASREHIEDGPLHHGIWTGLEELYRHFQRKIADLERDLAHDLVGCPYIRLLAIPGINVVSAAELAGEMGPMKLYLNANAITGRSGLHPSRHQSDQTDRDSGRIVRHANRRLRSALMRIADNLFF